MAADSHPKEGRPSSSDLWVWWRTSTTLRHIKFGARARRVPCRRRASRPVRLCCIQHGAGGHRGTTRHAMVVAAQRQGRRLQRRDKVDDRSVGRDRIRPCPLVAAPVCGVYSVCGKPFSGSSFRVRHSVSDMCAATSAYTPDCNDPEVFRIHRVTSVLDFPSWALSIHGEGPPIWIPSLAFGWVPRCSRLLIRHRQREAQRQERRRRCPESSVGSNRPGLAQSRFREPDRRK